MNESAHLDAGGGNPNPSPVRRDPVSASTTRIRIDRAFGGKKRELQDRTMAASQNFSIACHGFNAGRGRVSRPRVLDGKNNLIGSCDEAEWSLTRMVVSWTRNLERSKSGLLGLHKHSELVVNPSHR